MNEEFNYKDGIRETRKGSLGSSDGRLLQQIAENGVVPKSAYKRMAVLKGFIEQQEIPQTAAVKAGDEIEMLIYDYLKTADDSYQSNPLWISKVYSRRNCNLISHPDLVFVDNKNKKLKVYEVKSTKYNIEQTLETYNAQLYIHFLLANELAKSVLKGYKVELALVHYSTEGLPLENGIDFDLNRLTIKSVNFKNQLFDVKKAMDIVSAFLDTFNEYHESDEIDYEYLPANVQKQFDAITTALQEIKEREMAVNAFKERLYGFFKERGIKSIKSDAFNVVLVEPTQSVTVDYKTLFAKEIEAKTPRKAKKLKEQYKKTVARKGYVTIKIKDND